MKMKILAIIVASFGFIAACNGAPKIPNLPNTVITTDAQLKSAMAKAYNIIGGSVALIDAADKLEGKLFASGNVPAILNDEVIKLEDEILIALKKTTQDIDSHVLQTWADVQLRMQPIIGKLNSLLAIAKGTDFIDMFSSAVNLLAGVFFPGLRLETISELQLGAV